MKGVFDLRADSKYSDIPSEQYRFPNKLLGIALELVGDLVLYRESRRGGGRQGYVAYARIKEVVPDPSDPSYSYALVEEYLPFPEVVPLRIDGIYVEISIREIKQPKHIGVELKNHPMRWITDDEFERIVRLGLRKCFPARPDEESGGAEYFPSSTFSYGYGFAEEGPRSLERELVGRAVREPAFRLSVCRAYGNTCAVTGWHIQDRMALVEAQAAHIVPVAEGGPDAVQNGIAMTASVHWLFDHHLISVDENGRLLVAKRHVPPGLLSQFSERLRLPQSPELRPHSRFLAQHREAFARATAA